MTWKNFRTDGPEGTVDWQDCPGPHTFSPADVDRIFDEQVQQAREDDAEAEAADAYLEDLAVTEQAREHDRLTTPPDDLDGVDWDDLDPIEVSEDLEPLDLGEEF